MAKLEKEVKVLNIDVELVKDKLKEIGAEFVDEKNQKIYVYDIPTLYYRFLEIKQLLKTDNVMLINTNIKRLETLLVEFQDLVSDEGLTLILKSLNLNSLVELIDCQIDIIRESLENELLNKSLKNFDINPNKWLRLRESNGKAELTSKHILEKETSNIQNVLEAEVEVSSIEDTNSILESIGLARRSYQEKIRYSYKYQGASIEIDIWPMLDPYLEIEVDDENLIEDIITKLNLGSYEIVSLNTEQLYKRINIDVHNMSELKFEN